MTSTLIDTNILIDVLEVRQPHVGWITRYLAALADDGPLVINQVIYGEASVPYPSKQEFDELVLRDWLDREHVPWEAAFLAGKAFDDYRQRGGVKLNTLPDFLIGGHAAVKNYRVLTRDPARFRTYFPEVEVIAPDTHP
jgi:predicted nucleic acid-binding protein